jgi:hypothetical protein
MVSLCRVVMMLIPSWPNSTKHYASRTYLKRHCASFGERFVQCPNWYVFVYVRNHKWWIYITPRQWGVTLEAELCKAPEEMHRMMV